jgi:hypothetical protein
MPRPPAIPASRWQQIIQDAGRFLDHRACEAAALGWSARDVFGVHPSVPMARYDTMGLVPLILGGKVEAIDHRLARIGTLGGSTLTYLRREQNDGVCLWEMDSS